MLEIGEKHEDLALKLEEVLSFTCPSLLIGTLYLSNVGDAFQWCVDICVNIYGIKICCKVCEYMA